MTPFSVWAPTAGRVELVIGDERLPMNEVGHGWWLVEASVAAPVDYQFCLDGGDPLPDPRSQWQPRGVHGPSRHVDHTSFAWQCDAWPGGELLGSVVYELHVGTFTDEGTFDATIDRLDHLVSLGVDFVELLPVAAFPGSRGWGYDGVFPYAVQDSYGGPDGLKRFVDACHSRGLRVVLDVVYNHLGPDGNVLPRFGPYFTDKFATPWGQAVNFSDAGSDEVRRYFVDNALMWLRDYRFDALRLDAVHAIVDTSATHLLEELAVSVAGLSRELGRPLWLIAESDLNDPRLISPRDLGGYGLDAQWSDDFHHALHSVVTGETFGYYEDFGSLHELATALSRGFVFAGNHSKHRDRRHGRPLPASVASTRLLGYAQNHDQIGNRARGERIAALTSSDLVKVTAALVLLSPFTPMLFMGEEWAASTPWQYFTDHQDPQLAESVRKGRRNEFKVFGWEPSQVPDPQDVDTMRRSVLDWTEVSRAPHDDVLRWHRELIELRRANPVLQTGRFPSVSVDEPARLLVVDHGPLVVVANFGSAQATHPVEGERLLLSSAAASVSDDLLRLAPSSVAILARETSSG
ncbi:MAG TPA: malto-oligosyltrehalose trehalohydrolase [Acidothermaceae bacterium]|nr:malto-oligosyltrehalose trehalohydrolase [Acidothermaceae bacterium]